MEQRIKYGSTLLCALIAACPLPPLITVCSLDHIYNHDPLLTASAVPAASAVSVYRRISRRTASAHWRNQPASRCTINPQPES